MNYQNKKVMAEARNHPCQSCGADDQTIVGAHSNQIAHGKGMGIKSATIVAYLCYQCHTWLDQSNAKKQHKQEMWLLAARKSVPLYWRLLDAAGRETAERMVGCTIPSD